MSETTITRYVVSYCEGRSTNDHWSESFLTPADAALCYRQRLHDEYNYLRITREIVNSEDVTDAVLASIPRA